MAGAVRGGDGGGKPMLTITSCRALNEEAREEVVRAAYAFRDNADLRRLRAALDALDAVEGRNERELYR